MNWLGELFLVDFDFEDSDDEGGGGGGRTTTSYLELYQFRTRTSHLELYKLNKDHFAGLKKNCVYFPRGCFNVGKDDFPGWDVGLLDLDDDFAQPLKSVVSKIFWPPPTWLE